MVDESSEFLAIDQWAEMEARASRALPVATDSGARSHIILSFRHGTGSKEHCPLITVSFRGRRLGCFQEEGHALSVCEAAVAELEARAKLVEGLPFAARSAFERILASTIEDGFDRDSSIAEERYVGYRLGLGINFDLIHEWGLAPRLARQIASDLGIPRGHACRDEAVRCILNATVTARRPEGADDHGCGDEAFVGLGTNLGLSFEWCVRPEELACAMALSLLPLLSEDSIRRAS